MNRSSRTLAQIALTAGLVVAAVSLTGTAAQAEGPQGPGQISVQPHVDPKGPKIGIPTPPAEPGPGKPAQDGPDQLSDVPDEPVVDPAPQDPPSNPAPNPGPNPNPNPAEDGDLDQGCFTGCDLPEEPAAGSGTTDKDVVVAPNGLGTEAGSTVDAGFQPATSTETTAPAAAPADATGTAFWYGAGLLLLVLFALAAYPLRRRQARPHLA